MRVWKRNRFYSYEFVFEGRRIRASSKQGDREAAKKIASAHLTRLAEGRVGLTKAKRLTVGELLDRLELDYENDGRLDPKNRSLLKHVRADFATKMADELSGEQIRSYVQKRLAEGYAPATVNRRTEILRHAYRMSKLTPPEIARLTEQNVRQGFFPREQFDKLLGSLPEDLQDFCLFGFLTGMRKSEIASLRWNDVSENVIRLRGADAKTGRSRSIVCSGELAPLLERRRAALAVKAPGGEVAMAATIFHRDGQPVREFRKSWATACVASGLGTMVCPKCKAEGAARWCALCKRERRYQGKIFHDFRRTAVRNLVRAGVAERVCMDISGHRTRAVFDRYNIVSEDDLATAMLKLEAFGQPSNLREMIR